ncbi:MAG: AmmeMemoRadiSam system protein A [Planctomycetota bacterium]|jgi:AmmeMemoRadiSam system protein A
MNDIQKKTLLQVACKTVEAILTGGPLPKAGSSDAELNAHCGCFVTLKNHDRLRGCIGQFVSDRPLIELVVEMAKSSATRDPRFFNDMVTAAELEELDIEISVLSELLPTDDPLSLRLGVDGIYIKRGYASGCFLPQVAEDKPKRRSIYSRRRYSAHHSKTSWDAEPRLFKAACYAHFIIGESSHN